MELRYVTSEVIRKYNIALAPGQMEQAFADEVKDGFTLAVATLNLVFQRREDV